MRIDVLNAVDEAAIVLMARHRNVLGQHVQAFVVEIADVLVVVLFGLRVGLGDRDQLQEAGAIRIGIRSALFDELPEPVHHALAEVVAPVRQEAIAVVVLGREVPRAQAAAARDPHGRMRLLYRTRPQIDHRQFEVLAVPREDFLAVHAFIIRSCAS